MHTITDPRPGVTADLPAPDESGASARHALRGRQIKAGLLGIRLKAWLWPLVLLGSFGLSLLAHVPAFAATLPHGQYLAAGSGIPPVNYGANADTGFAGQVSGAAENVASTIRDLLGATALLVILVAAVMNHFVHDQRAKERAKELIGAAVVGLLVAAFAPQIVNFIASL